MLSRVAGRLFAIGPWRILALLAVQTVLLLTFLVDWKVPPVLAAGFLVTVLLLDNPLWAVGAMLAARLLSTGTMSFFSIGKITIGMFEPVLLLALIALGLRAVFDQRTLWQSWPWRAVFLSMILWRVLGLGWTDKFSDGAKEIIGLSMILATASVILAFVRTWEHVRAMLWWWIGASVVIGILAIFGDAIGLTNYATQWQASESGGRETGLGQQPNWFAMNLSFAVPAAAAFGLIQKRPLLRWGLLAASLFIFLAMMTSGSRGGAASVVIAGGVAALGQPLFRKWFVRFAATASVLIGLVVLLNLGDFAKGFTRIAGGLTFLFQRDIRGSNWAACWGMFTDTYGVGIGPGGYVDNLQKYSDWLYNSVYRYPHGIFWGELAHTGVLGLLLLGTLVVVIVRMAIQTVRDTRGSEAEGLAWTMPASMFGYFAWSFVEFNIYEKPFWEWLGLYTALHLVARRAADTGVPLPAWSLGPK